MKARRDEKVLDRTRIPVRMLFAGRYKVDRDEFVRIPGKTKKNGEKVLDKTTGRQVAEDNETEVAAYVLGHLDPSVYEKLAPEPGLDPHLVSVLGEEGARRVAEGEDIEVVAAEVKAKLEAEAAEKAAEEARVGDGTANALDPKPEDEDQGDDARG